MHRNRPGAGFFIARPLGPNAKRPPGTRQGLPAVSCGSRSAAHCYSRLRLPGADRSPLSRPQARHGVSADEARIDAGASHLGYGATGPASAIRPAGAVLCHVVATKQGALHGLSLVYICVLGCDQYKRLEQLSLLNSALGDLKTGMTRQRRQLHPRLRECQDQSGTAERNRPRRLRLGGTNKDSVVLAETHFWSSPVTQMGYLNVPGGYGGWHAPIPFWEFS